MTKMILMCCIAGGAALLASDASAQAVSVLGGGLAKQCALAATTGGAEAQGEETCTTALTTEAMSQFDRAGTYVNRGVLKLRRKDFAEAELDFTSALVLVPGMGEAYLNRGASRVGARQYAEGVTDLDKALSLGVREPEKAFYNRALASERLDRMVAAYLDYRKAVELKPGWEQPQKELLRVEAQRP